MQVCLIDVRGAPSLDACGARRSIFTLPDSPANPSIMNENAESVAESTERRAFLQNIVSAGAVVAGAGLLGACATANASRGGALASASESESPLWDMSWQKRLGKYRTVYDAPQPQNGAPLYVVASTIAGYKAALPKSAHEFTPVLVLRHNASFMTVNDSMWKRLKANERLTPKATADKYPDHNPFINFVPGTQESLVSATSALTALQKDGTIILVCNRALTALSFGLARSEPTNFKNNDEALKEIRKNLIPGVIPMPNGIFAVAAAQDAGCGYMPIPAE